jgi:hypothetical protein
MSHRITGSGLLSLVEEHGSDSKSQLVSLAGYIKPDGKLAYCDFYEALIDAKKANNLWHYPEPESTETRDDLTSSEEILWDHIKDRLNLDDSELDDIFDEFTDLGIENPDQFDDAYVGTWDNYNAEAEFAEQLADELGLLNDDHFFSFAIDWQRVWDHSLSYDYNVVAGVYFFSNNF